MSIDSVSTNNPENDDREVEAAAVALAVIVSLSCGISAGLAGIPADLARSISIPADPFLRISDRVKKIRIEKWKINAAVGGEKRKLDRSYGSGIKYSMFEKLKLLNNDRPRRVFCLWGRVYLNFDLQKNQISVC